MKWHELFLKVMIISSTLSLFTYAIFRDEIRALGLMNNFLVVMVFVWIVALVSLILYLIKTKKEK